MFQWIFEHMKWNRRRWLLVASCSIFVVSEIENGAPALQNGFCRKFHRLHQQRRAGDRRRGNSGRHLFDLLLPSSEGEY